MIGFESECESFDTLYTFKQSLRVNSVSPFGHDLLEPPVGFDITVRISAA